MDQRDLDEVRVLGRRWARDVATAEQLHSALHAAEGGIGMPLAPSAQAFLAANAPPELARPGEATFRRDVVDAFLDGIVTSEGEE
jgi:hypothetical protein